MDDFNYAYEADFLNSQPFYFDNGFPQSNADFQNPFKNCHTNINNNSQPVSLDVEYIDINDLQTQMQRVKSCATKDDFDNFDQSMYYGVGSTFGDSKASQSSNHSVETAVRKSTKYQKECQQNVGDEIYQFYEQLDFEDGLGLLSGLCQQQVEEASSPSGDVGSPSPDTSNLLDLEDKSECYLLFSSKSKVIESTWRWGYL